MGHERDGESPIFGAYVEKHLSITPPDQAMHLLIFVHELLAIKLVLGFIVRGDERVPLPEDPRQGRIIVILDGHQ
jgi:hypothetical protein